MWYLITFDDNEVYGVYWNKYTNIYEIIQIEFRNTFIIKSFN